MGWAGQRRSRRDERGVRVYEHERRDTTHTRAASKGNEPGVGRKWRREGGRAGERKGGEGDARRDG